MFCEPSLMASKLRSLNDLPDEILLKILSHFGPDDLCLIIAKVCERWNVLAKGVVLWKKLMYSCDSSSDTSRIAEVRCTKLFGFRTNSLTNFAPSSALKVENLRMALVSYIVSWPCTRIWRSCHWRVAFHLHPCLLSYPIPEETL